MIILIHSSKTMRQTASDDDVSKPQLINEAVTLQKWLATKSAIELQTIMKTSSKIAAQTKGKIEAWSTTESAQTPAMDTFVGDIYSGLQANTFTPEDKNYAQKHLRILSGLYGVLRPLDGIMPYRLEMAYKTPGLKVANLYQFWDDKIAQTLPTEDPIINVSSDEYTKAVLPYIDTDRVITPRFLTYDKTKKQPVFVVVHAKIARGAFAGWILKNRISKISELKKFDELGYSYDASLSSTKEPVFVCQQFKGLGLSVRLS